jgi:hypothetical protein
MRAPDCYNATTTLMCLLYQLRNDAVHFMPHLANYCSKSFTCAARLDGGLE